MSRRVEIITEMKSRELIEKALNRSGIAYAFTGGEFIIKDDSIYIPNKIIKKGQYWVISGESSDVDTLKSKVVQEYARQATLEEARLAGHDIVSEEILSDGTIKLLLSASTA